MRLLGFEVTRFLFLFFFFVKFLGKVNAQIEITPICTAFFAFCCTFCLLAVKSVLQNNLKNTETLYKNQFLWLKCAHV